MKRYTVQLLDSSRTVIDGDDIDYLDNEIIIIKDGGIIGIIIKCHVQYVLISDIPDTINIEIPTLKECPLLPKPIWECSRTVPQQYTLPFHTTPIEYSTTNNSL